MSDFLKRNRTVLLITFVVVAVIGGWLYTRGNASETATTFQTATVARGKLIATIGATGTVRAKQTATMIWQTAGIVDTVNVKVGDNVPKDFVMAYLSKTSLSQNIIMAESELVSAQQALDDLINSDTAIAQANQNLVNAKQAVEDAEEDVLRLDYPRATDDLIAQTEDEIILANRQVSRAEDAFKRVKNLSDGDPLKAEVELALINARLNRDKKIATLNWYLGKPSDLDAEEYRAALNLALAKLDDAQREYDRLTAGNIDQIQAAQARVDAAQATLNLARVLAPFPGIVTASYPLSGDLVSAGTQAFRLDNLSSLYVDVEVSEVDINSVKVGQPVALTFDAILGKDYQGKVVEVSNVGSVSGGIVNFKVTVELTTVNDLVKPGMTAAVDITVKELDDVVIVPNRAVRLIEGVRYVYVLGENGLPEKKRITISFSSGQQSAISDGEIVVGDVIILNPPVEFGPGGGGPGGGSFGN